MTVAERKPGQGCCWAGLALGVAALWLQPLPFSCTQGHHTEPLPEPQHPASLWSSLALVLVGAGR